jgi:hypothetical protein
MAFMMCATYIRRKGCNQPTIGGANMFRSPQAQRPRPNSRGLVQTRVRNCPKQAALAVSWLEARRMKKHTLFCLLLVSIIISGFVQLGCPGTLVVDRSPTTISDGTAPRSCGTKLLGGITCWGSFCDNITLICGTATSSTAAPSYKIIGDIEWTERISEEEGIEGRGCSDLRFISGLSCKGKNCDDVFLECVELDEAYPSGSDCMWTYPWVTDSKSPSNTVRFPKDFAAVAMACKGRFCDDIRFKVCRVLSR